MKIKKNVITKIKICNHHSLLLLSFLSLLILHLYQNYQINNTAIIIVSITIKIHAIPIDSKNFMQFIPRISYLTNIIADSFSNTLGGAILTLSISMTSLK